MAWTTPRTWVAGELETAAIFNPHVRDNFNAILTNATTLNATIVTSSLTAVGTITTGVWNAGAVTSSGNIKATSAGNGYVQINTDNNRFRFSGEANHNYIDSGYDDAGGDIIFRTRTSGTPVTNLTLYGSGNSTFGGVLTVTGLFTGNGGGNNQFSAAVNGSNYLTVENTTSNTISFAKYQLAAGTAAGAIALYSQGYTTGTYDIQDGMALVCAGAGGVTVSLAAGGSFNVFGTALRARIESTGSLQIGGIAARAGTAGTKRIDIFDGTAPTSTLANGISIYSTAGECFIMDAGGTATQQTPHDRLTGEWIFNCTKTHTGEVLRIDVERMLRFLNDQFNLDAVHESYISLKE
jgi:hypothetical protein